MITMTSPQELLTVKHLAEVEIIYIRDHFITLIPVKKCDVLTPTKHTVGCKN